jgi:aryl-alcohol dehydrogenase-like predicted oxidoreductase
VPFVSHQRQYSMLWRVGERTVAPVEDELGIGRLAWSPAAGGVLTGKYRPGSLPDGTRATAAAGGARLFGLFDFLDDAVLEAVARLAPLAREAGLTMAQLAVAWVLRSPAVPAAIVGASRPEQLAETVGAVGVGLDDDLLALIDAALGPVVRR